jgi:type II secretory pathway component PulK
MAIKLFFKKSPPPFSLFKKQKGFALIFVLVFVAMIMGVVGDIVYQTQVGARGSIEERNALDAQSTALTGIEFAKLMLSLNILAQKYQGNPLIPIPKNMYNLLNGQPIGSSGLEKLEELSGANISKAIAPSIQQALKVVPGYFVLNIVSENTKFNLNMLQATFSADAQKALLRIFSSPDSQKFIEVMGYTPQELVDNLTSYIKISPTNGFAAQSAYDQIEAKYKPKNAALESLEELRRIPGFNIDDIYNMYSPYFTIWPIGAKTGALNINSAPIELIAALLTPNGQEIIDQDWDKFENDREKNAIKQNNSNWFSNNLSGFKDNEDSKKIVKNFFGNSDNIFKVESRGVVNGVEKTLTVVFQQDAATSSNQQQNQGNNNDKNSDQQNQNNPNQQQNQGNNNDKNNNQQKSNSAPKFTVIYSAWK